MPILSLVLSIFFLAISHYFVTELTISGWSYFQVATWRCLICLIPSFLFVRKRNIRAGLFLSIPFGLFGVLFYPFYLKNSAQAITVLYLFPLLILLFKLVKSKIHKDWSMIFIFLQTFLGLVIMNRLSFSFIFLSDLIFLFLSAILLSSFYLISEQKNYSKEALPGLFLGGLIFGIGGLLYFKEYPVLESYSWDDLILITGISLFGTYWVFKTYFDSLGKLGSEIVALFYYYLPMFHFIFVLFTDSSRSYDIPDYLAGVVLFFGPILYLVSIDEKKRSVALGIKLD